MKKKTMAMIVCAAMIISSAALGTVAYLIDQTEIVNAFSVGKVHIVLDETITNEDGEASPIYQDGNGNTVPADKVNVDAEGKCTHKDTGEELTKVDRAEEGNRYHLVPGGSYTKDPTITVKADGEDSYIRMKVTITNAAAFKAVFGEFPGTNVVGWDSETWVSHGKTEDSVNDTVVYEFRYTNKDENKTQIVAASDVDVKLDALFDGINVPAAVTNEQLEALNGMKITVTGEAIQATGFKNAEAAWAEFDKSKTPPATP